MSKISRSKRLVASLVLACCLVFAYAIYRQARQVELDHKLIQALRQLDSSTALQALAEGADANAHERPQPPRSVQQMVRSLFGRSSRSTGTYAPSALFVAIDWRWREVAHEGEFWLTSYTPANAPPQNPKVIAELLEHGADVHATNEVGMTPLQIAAWEGKSATVRLLLEHGAEVNVYGPTKSIISRLRGTPLQFALASENIPTIRALLDYHADINTIRDGEGYTALEKAQVCENSVAVRLLKEALKQHKWLVKPRL